MSSPRISVVMPVWNAGRFLGRTLDSVIGQTFDDFEVVCTNDGSTDDSLDVLRAYARRDPRIRVIAAEHTGAGATLNRCLDEARGADLTAVERKNLARMQAALDECNEYHDRLHGVAIKAIDFDLDDGVVVNYAKFGDVVAKIK